MLLVLVCSITNHPQTMKNASIDYTPLGLFGFSITSILISLHGLGVFPLNALVISMALVFGGATQLLVGLQAYKHGYSFAGITFSAYGLYWLSYVGILLLPALNIVPTPPASLVGSYFILWGIFTSTMTIIAHRLSRLDFIIFLTLAVVYFSLALHQFLPFSSINILSSIMGIICGCCAFYLAMTKVLQQELVFLPLPAQIVLPSKNTDAQQEHS